MDFVGAEEKQREAMTDEAVNQVIWRYVNGTIHDYLNEVADSEEMTPLVQAIGEEYGQVIDDLGENLPEIIREVVSEGLEDFDGERKGIS